MPDFTLSANAVIGLFVFVGLFIVAATVTVAAVDLALRPVQWLWGRLAR